MTTHGNEHPVDEHELAALLAGTLPDAERQRLLARLASDPEARIVLQMAIEAMEAVQGPESAFRQRGSASERGRRAA